MSAATASPRRCEILSSFPSPLVGEGGFAKRRRVRGTTYRLERDPSSGTDFAYPKHRRPLKRAETEGRLWPPSPTRGEGKKAATTLDFRSPSNCQHVIVDFGD